VKEGDSSPVVIAGKSCIGITISVDDTRIDVTDHTVRINHGASGTTKQRTIGEQVAGVMVF
jgi:hypothetical protein